MVAIRSTELKATSNNNGLCNVLREMVEFTFNIKKLKFITIVKDTLFQEKQVTQTILEKVDGVETEKEILVTERKIIDTRNRKAKSYTFKMDSIEAFYQVLGTAITKSTGFSPGLIENLTITLIAQTKEANRQTMSDWIPDTPHVIVEEFSE